MSATRGETSLSMISVMNVITMPKPSSVSMETGPSCLSWTPPGSARGTPCRRLRGWEGSLGNRYCLQPVDGFHSFGGRTAPLQKAMNRRFFSASR
jgi:hypothetical protein